MSFNEYPDRARISNRALAIVGAGALAVSTVGFVTYKTIDAFHDTVNSVIGFAQAGKPKENVAGDVQAAVGAVQIPTAMPILEAPVSSDAKVNTYTSIWGHRLPFFGH